MVSTEFQTLGSGDMCKMQIKSRAKAAWQKDGKVWQVLWKTLPPIAKICEQLTKYDCKTKCKEQC